MPAKGLGWPDQPLAWTPGSAGLHHGHAEPEGPELSDGTRAEAIASGSADTGGFGSLGTGSTTEVGGLGWPQLLNENVSSVPVPAPSGAHVAGDSARAALGRAGTATSARDPDRMNGSPDAAHPSPSRVQQALSAAVSRETAALMADGSHRSEPAGNALEEAMQGGTTAQDDANAGGVVIPDVPQNPRDTPIARAAEAAVGVRGAGDSQRWPRPAGCRIMTIANQKGGVGKTTTAVNLAASLSQHGARVLVIDLDPQGNASTALDVDHRVGTPSVYNTLVEDRPLADVVRPVEGLPGLYCAPATIDLAGAEIELVPLVARESRLGRAVSAYDSSNLDYILIDCPPSLGLLTLNALVAAREVLIPIQCEYYALEGLEQLLRTVDLVKGHLNQDLQISTILLTMYDGRTRLASQVADDVRSHFGDVVLQSIIPRSVRVSEAPSYGQSVITYDPGSSGSIAYVEAARELSQRHPEMAG
jgi:chromosome partitioning protein